MRILPFSTLGALGLAMVVAGCDGTGVPAVENPAQRFSELNSENQSLASRVDAANVTSSLNYPRGVVSYDGTAALTLGTPTQSVLLGDSVLRADFTSRTVTGRADNFVGRINGGPARAFDGNLNIASGTIVPGRNRVVDAPVNGVLVSGADTVAVNGRIGGYFYGTAGQLFEADATTATQFRLNGAPYASGGRTGLTVRGER